MVLSALPICRREARRWAHTPLDLEDLEGIAALALVRAGERFDEERGVPFLAYARFAVKSALFDVVRQKARRDSLGDGSFAIELSFEGMNATDDDDKDPWDPQDPRVLEETIENREILRIVYEMPARERHVLLRTRVDGASARRRSD